MTFPCFRCGESEALRNYKLCVRGQVGGTEEGHPAADERGLSTPHTTWTHIPKYRHAGKGKGKAVWESWESWI